MRILVTGGAGFIGSHLVDALVGMGHDVVIYDNLEPQVHKGVPTYLNKNAELIKADVRDKDALKGALQDAEVLFHLAARVGIGQSMYQIENFMDVNTLGTSRILDILVNEEHDLKKFVLASSMSIYGEGAYRCDDCGTVYPTLRTEEQFRKGLWEMRCPDCKKEVHPVPTNESKPLQPTSIYAISKKDQEEMSLVVGKTYGIPTVALRYFNVFGPRQSLNNPYTGVCAIFSSRIKNGNAPLVYEDGLQSRDFVSVHDIVKANILSMEQQSADHEVFNVGAGRTTTIRDIGRILIKLYNRELTPAVTNKFRAGDIRHCTADITKISKRLGYSPSVDFEKGMKELVEWGENEDATDTFDTMHEELVSRGLVDA